VNPFVLYLFLLKTVTAFSGLASLPVVRADLVVNHHVLTDQQLLRVSTSSRSCWPSAQRPLVSTRRLLAFVRRR
jgi:hypothetical protein